VIPTSFIQELVSRLDIVEVVGRSVELKKAGINHKGLCPFHGEKTPSFIVSPSRQTYHCFGCGAHGDALRFVIEHRGLGFVDAVHELAQQAGMQVPEDDATPEERARAAQAKAQQASLTDVLARAAEHYRKQLKGSPRAIAYLKRRGLTGQVAAHFGLGYAPEGWRGLASVFPAYDDPLLAESGLVIVQGEDEAERKRYDRFRDRIMFPIRSVQGEVIGFGGRVLDQGEPKYLNSPETPVFVKGRELYGLYEARQALRQKGYVLVVEGYMDVVALAQLGFPNAVATLGTACTADHVLKLFRFTDSVVFSFDGDAAGRRAAGRALEAALPHAGDTRSIRFLFLPPEHDPDSYVREQGPEAFERCIAEAVPLSRQLLDTAQEGCDLATPEGRARTAARAKPLWQALPEGGFKRQMLAELARLCGLGDADLLAQWEGADARGRRGARAAADEQDGGHGDPDPYAAQPERSGGWREGRREGRRDGGRDGGWREGGWRGRGRDGQRGDSERPRGSGRALVAGTPTLLDRALWLLLQRCELWDALGGGTHDLLAEQPAPYGPAFAWLERHVHEHGNEQSAALLAEMARQDLGPQGTALAGRMAQLHAPGDVEHVEHDLQLVIGRLRVVLLKDEQRLLAESGLDAQDMAARYRELQREIDALNARMAES
jgi:DNA primase